MFWHKNFVSLGQLYVNMCVVKLADSPMGEKNSICDIDISESRFP